MGKSNTSLSKIYEALKKTLFSNQVIFYNLLFVITRDCEDSFFTELVLNIEHFFSNMDLNSFINSAVSKNFYRRLLCSVDEVAIESNYPSLKSNDINTDTARSDVSQAMKKKGANAIPKYWRDTYLNNNKRNLYKDNLDIILKYYIIMYHYDKIDLSKSSGLNNLTLQDKIWNQISKNASISDFSLAAINTFEQLENAIINRIYIQCSQNTQNHLHAQWDFYQSHIECYGDRNIDKYYVLEQYAYENVYCAYELADIYYFGAEFSSGEPGDKWKIEQNYEIAAKYFHQCSIEPNIIVPACWSLGYMYYKEMIDKGSPDNINKAIKYFKKCGNYPPALNDLGLIDKKKADAIYDKKDYRLLTPDEKDFCAKHYISFIEKCYSACCSDWVYGFNNLYVFYFDDKYDAIRNDLQNHSSYFELDPINLLQQAARKKNSWAMDTLALHYICDYFKQHQIMPEKTPSEMILMLKCGELTLKDLPPKLRNKPSPQLQEAKDILKYLDSINYSRATYHMAINFYYDSPFMVILLEKAASYGHKQSIEAIEKIKNMQ